MLSLTMGKNDQSLDFFDDSDEDESDEDLLSLFLLSDELSLALDAAS